MPEDITPTPDTKPEPPQRAVAYYYTDSRLEEKYPVLDTRESAWWMDGGTKLNLLLQRFRVHDTVKQACYLAGITEEQYKHFRSLHPWLVPLIRVYKTLPAIKLKEIILETALGGEKQCGKCSGRGKFKNGNDCPFCDATGMRKVEPNAKVALGAYRIFEAVEDDEDFAPAMKGVPTIPLGGASKTIVAQEIIDSDGNVVMSRRAMELIENHDAGGNS